MIKRCSGRIGYETELKIYGQGRQFQKRETVLLLGHADRNKISRSSFEQDMAGKRKTQHREQGGCKTWLVRLEKTYCSGQTWTVNRLEKDMVGILYMDDSGHDSEKIRQTDMEHDIMNTKQTKKRYGRPTWNTVQ